MSQDEVVQKVFYGLQFAGLGGMAIILLTALLSPTISKRHPIFLNFNITWIISCVSYVLLVGKPLDWVPNHRLCFAQAVLIYTVPILTAGTTIALVIHVLITLKAVLNSSTGVVSHSKVLTAALVLVPYIPASLLAGLSIATGLKHPDGIGRQEDGLYCNMTSKTPGKVSAVAVAATMFACFVLEVFICLDLRRNWTTLKCNPRSTSMSIRVSLFTLFGVAAIAISMVFFFTSEHDAKLNIMLAVVPVTAVLVFGTQRDIIDSWMRGLRWILRLPPKEYGSQARSSTFRSTHRSSVYRSMHRPTDIEGHPTSYPPEFWNMKDDSSSTLHK